MNRNEFLRRARRYARRNQLEHHFEPEEGKGSHGAFYLAGRRTFVPEGKIRTGTFFGMLKQLGIDPRRF